MAKEDEIPEEEQPEDTQVDDGPEDDKEEFSIDTPSSFSSSPSDLPRWAFPGAIVAAVLVGVLILYLQFSGHIIF